MPIALHYLGAEGYGLWIALMSTYGLLNFVDFGLGVGMQQKMAVAYGQEDWTQLRRTFISGVAALAVLGLVCLAVLHPKAALVDSRNHFVRWLGERYHETPDV